MEKLLLELRFSAVDVETTGLSPEMGSEMVEIAVVKMKLGIIEEVWSSLIKIEGKMDEEAGQVHGISEKELTHAPELKDVIDDFIYKIRDSVILAHNAQFDLGFINMAIYLNKKKHINLPTIDLLGISRFLQPYFPNHRLSNIAEILNVPRIDVHRAAGDALLTSLIFTKYADIYNLWNISLSNILKFQKPSLKLSGIDNIYIDALNRRLILHIVYEGAGGLSERDVMPVAIKNKTFLEAYCFKREKLLSFKLDGIRSIDVIESI
ncbi:MAG: exonuclease domain-containing protein [bacterium]